MQYSMADPRIIDPIDVISDIDRRPNLLELSPKEFEAFIQNLFTKMGYDTKLYRASGDGGIDCVAYDPHPITGGEFIVQAKLYTRTVRPTHVRDLWGTVQHEGATKGIMITTSGYGPDSYKFAGGKPLNLIDGSGLLSLCQQCDIPARILNRDRKSPAPDSGDASQWQATLDHYKGRHHGLVVHRRKSSPGIQKLTEMTMAKILVIISTSEAIFRS
jgi:restriction system protein